MPVESSLMFLPITRHAMLLINEYSVLTDVQAQSRTEAPSSFYCLIKAQEWIPSSSH